MGRPLKFKKIDYEFIARKFPDYYKLLVPKAHEEQGEIWVSTKNQADYDSLLDQVCLEIGDAATSDGEMSEDGLRLEAAWDYADREGVPFSEKD